MTFIIQTDGTIVGRYTELFDLKTVGKLSIRRFSDMNAHDDATWHFVLRTDTYEVMGPYPTHSVALKAEEAEIDRQLPTLHKPLREWLKHVWFDSEFSRWRLERKL